MIIIILSLGPTSNKSHVSRINCYTILFLSFFITSLIAYDQTTPTHITQLSLVGWRIFYIPSIDSTYCLVPSLLFTQDKLLAYIYMLYLPHNYQMLNNNV